VVATVGDGGTQAGDHKGRPYRRQCWNSFNPLRMADAFAQGDAIERAEAESLRPERFSRVPGFSRRTRLFVLWAFKFEVAARG
jgi:hypothetical protein